jgi:hypothetical protein
MMVTFAGVTSGSFMPLQDTMFGPNSFFYMNRMLFLGGFLMSTIIGTLSEGWMKLQQDSLNDGKFENVPQERTISYLRWLKEQTFNEENSLWKNHVNYCKIIFANMKPALVLTALTQLPTLGRIDMDSYIGGYILNYTTPTASTFMKLEQGYERTAGYFLKDIPEEYWSHPLIQRYLSDRRNGTRVVFSLFDKLVLEFAADVVANFSSMATADFGSRSFLRLIFGGWTPTEILRKGVDSTDPVSRAIPGAGIVAKICKKILSDNYTDWKMYKPK